MGLKPSRPSWDIPEDDDDDTSTTEEEETTSLQQPVSKKRDHPSSQQHQQHYVQNKKNNYQSTSQTFVGGATGIPINKSSSAKSSSSPSLKSSAPSYASDSSVLSSHPSSRNGGGKSYSSTSTSVSSSKFSTSSSASPSSLFMAPFLKSRTTSSSLLEFDSTVTDNIGFSCKDQSSHEMTTLETYFKYFGCQFVDYIGRGTFAHCFKVVYQEKDMTPPPPPSANNSNKSQQRKDIHHLSQQEYSCLKLVEISNNPKIEERLKQEIQILRVCDNCKYITKLLIDYRLIDTKLDYKNIMKGRNWIVQILEYGDSIMKVLKDYESQNRTVSYFTLGELYAYFTQAIECLYELHEVYHIIHRDVKLTNILLKSVMHARYNEQMYRFMLCDFNVSMFDKDERKGTSNTTSKKSLVGTSIFVPNEVIFTGDYTNKVDMYSMGVVFILLFGMVGGDSDFLERFYCNDILGPLRSDKKSAYSNSFYGNQSVYSNTSLSSFANHTNQIQPESAPIELNSILERISSKYYLNIPLIGNLLLDMTKYFNERPSSKEMYETNMDYNYLYYIVNGFVNTNELDLLLQSCPKYVQESENIVKYIILTISQISSSTCYDIDIICNCLKLLKSRECSRELCNVILKWILQCDMTEKKQLAFMNQVIELMNSFEESSKRNAIVHGIIYNEHLRNNSSLPPRIESLHYFIKELCHNDNEKVLQYIQEFNTELSKTTQDPSITNLLDTFIQHHNQVVCDNR
ncbi:hypothetical protein C9374_006851 [Naegleria lovaniensis]|uniref:mitogen-activated protein kinase kinase n=1 Tax=Naegleria lovaniensis TaxID=51637 RepID=A0AA88GYI6_NAELO|nr:uncharacterized protein C9374_006851 [Naegleria lovaniensis]KAG2393320.1 hypothetical protein C9374_006851 [Naegleria lovaniensis]